MSSAKLYFISSIKNGFYKHLNSGNYQIPVFVKASSKKHIVKFYEVKYKNITKKKLLKIYYYFIIIKKRKKKLLILKISNFRLFFLQNKILNIAKEYLLLYN